MYESRFSSLRIYGGLIEDRCSLWLCLRPNQTYKYTRVFYYTLFKAFYGGIEGNLDRGIGKINSPLLGASAPNVLR